MLETYNIFERVIHVEIIEYKLDKIKHGNGKQVNNIFFTLSTMLQLVC